MEPVKIENILYADYVALMADINCKQEKICHDSNIQNY